MAAEYPAHLGCTLFLAREALRQCPKVELCIVADGSSEGDRIVGLRDATSGLPSPKTSGTSRYSRREPTP